MRTSFWKLLYAIYGLEGGRDCRQCRAAVSPGDAFGISEGVCRACRLEASGE